MALGRKQLLLPLDSPAIAAERAVAADHSVAGDQHTDVIIAVGGANRPHRFGLTDRRRDLGIAARFACRDLAQLAPHCLLKSSASHIDRQGRRGERAVDRLDAPSTSSFKAAVILPRSWPWGTAAATNSSLSSNVSRQMPFSVAAMNMVPEGLSNVVQRMV